METKQGTSKTKLIVGVSIVAIILLIIAGAVYALVVANTPKQTSTTQTDTQPKSKTVTQQTLNQNINDLDSSVKQAQESQQGAASAINDTTKQVKVSQ